MKADPVASEKSVRELRVMLLTPYRKKRDTPRPGTTNVMEDNAPP